MMHPLLRGLIWTVWDVLDYKNKACERAPAQELKAHYYLVSDWSTCRLPFSSIEKWRRTQRFTGSEFVKNNLVFNKVTLDYQTMFSTETWSSSWPGTLEVTALLRQTKSGSNSWLSTHLNRQKTITKPDQILSRSRLWSRNL